MFPRTPSDFKALIPSVAGSFCEKFLRSLQLPNLVYDIIAYIINEDGTFTDEFKADICNLSCKCAGGAPLPGGGGLASPLVSASDGQFADKVQITWGPVNGALTYDLYRANSNSAGSATILAADLGTTSYDDSTVTPGTYYYYFVKAKNGLGSSAFSNGDRGFAGSIATTLPAITDLVASQGIRRSGPSTICLTFTAVSGADTYDIYRNTVDDFATATRIDGDRVPFDYANSSGLGTSPLFIDQVGQLNYFHDPGSPSANYYAPYYFWVIAKKSGPPAQTPQSNSALGWVVGRGDGSLPHSNAFIEDGAGGTAIPYTVPSGIIELWLVGLGSGAGGAGGGAVYGGGGGGEGPVLTGKLAVVAGAKLRVVSTPSGVGTTQAAGETNGQNGSQYKLQYSANGTFSDAIDIFVGNAPSGGVYNAGGSGAGGAGSTGTKHASVVGGQIYAGKAGLAGNGAKGGRSGYPFGASRKPAATDGTYGASSAGGGGNANAAAPSLRKAGRGVNGVAIIIAYQT